MREKPAGQNSLGTESVYVSMEKHEDLLRIADEARGFVEEGIKSGKIEEGVAPAAKLLAFNVMRRYPPSAEGRKRGLEKIYEMSVIERDYKEKADLLPTIGIEIETPLENLNASRRGILDRLDIKNEDALDAEDKLWEVNPEYSYSPLAQSRILQELAVMGAIPIDEKTGRVPGDVPLSLHLNFGFVTLDKEEEFKISERYKQELEYLNDILAYGFASPYRVAHRKSRLSFQFQPASDEDKEGFYRRDEPALLRLELRANEFRDYPTYRLIAEAQALVGCLFAYIKQEEGYTGETKLASLWKEVRKRIESYLAEDKGLFPNIMDRFPEFAVREMEKSEFKKECRKIITRCAKAVLKEVSARG